MEATHEITAVYWPKRLEVELSWKDLETGERVELITKVTAEFGEAISKIVWPCVYSKAIIRKEKEQSDDDKRD